MIPGFGGALSVALVISFSLSVRAAEATETAKCSETKIAAPLEEGRSIPLHMQAGRGNEIWFAMKCGSDDPWFTGPLFVRNVSTASLTPFLPQTSGHARAAMIIAPGGGTVLLSMDREGYGIARWLRAQGIAALVLKYRTVPTPANGEAFVAMVRELAPPYSSGGPAVITPEQGAAEEHATLDDGVAAIRYVRDHAREFGIDPKHVGMIGFSAGAYTTLAVATKADPADRPNLIGAAYGSLPGSAVPSSASPPAFIVAATDDPQVPVAEDIRTYTTWKVAGAPVELHLFEHGGHGFGSKTHNTGTDQWRTLFAFWLGKHGFLPKR